MIMLGKANNAEQLSTVEFRIPNLSEAVQAVGDVKSRIRRIRAVSLGSEKGEMKRG